MPHELRRTLGTIVGDIASAFSDPLLVCPPVAESEADAAFRTCNMEGWTSVHGDDVEDIIFTLPRSSEIIPIKKRPEALYPEQIGVGRAQNVDVQVIHASVSKYHAVFTEQEGQWRIADASSKNGTFVNGKRLDPKSPVLLSQRAKIRFGGVTTFLILPDAK